MQNGFILFRLWYNYSRFQIVIVLQCSAFSFDLILFSALKKIDREALISRRVISIFLDQLGLSKFLINENGLSFTLWQVVILISQ